MADEAGGKAGALRKLAIAAAVGAALLVGLHLLRPLAHVLLLAFAGLLFSVFLDAAASAIVRRTRLPRGAAVAIVVLCVFAVPALVGVVAGPGIAEQLTALFRTLPDTWNGVRTWLQGTRWGPGILAWLPDVRQTFNLESATVHGIAAFFTTVFQGFVGAFVILFIGIYVSLAPAFYVDGALKLVPSARRARYRRVAWSIVRALRRWLIGRMVAMAVVGALVTLGLWIADVPYPLALGLIAALLEFVPYVGPVAAAVPGILVALSASPVTALYALVVFIAVQAAENYVVSPLVEHRAVSLGPAVLVVAQVLMGVLFGGLGVLLATPFTVVVVIAIQMLYVEDVLGDRTRVLGEC